MAATCIDLLDAMTVDARHIYWATGSTEDSYANDVARAKIDGTGIDFSGLVRYDGFSEHESTTGARFEEPLDSLEQVRV